MNDSNSSATAELAIVTIPLGPIGTNCYVVSLDGSSCVVIDPGGDGDKLNIWLAEQKLSVAGILVTHCHWDHIGAVADVATAHSCEVWMSRVEAPVLEDIGSFAPAEYGPYTNHHVDHMLDGGESIECGGITFDVIHLPGHSPGTMGFLVGGSVSSGAFAADAEPVVQQPVLFIGDLIFQGSVGRTDLPFADHDTLLSSCKRVLDLCPDDTVLLSGHGPATLVGAERRSNPFLRDLA